ncbi:hypothetical protein QN382_19045 [Pseudomonas sp. 10B1]|uniref:hypothetical protein n=1 Tax=unclassified Pseudomonas TaxID=196821 RepID=UPI002AB5640D|nr:MULTISPECIES: hypothetical protein [unclassified Pseudomonas]MDY7560177.1 hypothetical protein [Pseudomonas sp. AB6]MEA9994289.1 hypothetical protein [Pseudomonas sp. AA4]MEB0126543.1 hypothetical protein [Pseudomonas sp. CCC1.2]MEB0154644.1 hypothetical protein [Pseudomonas sp. CCC4.3]MEB0178726.1 hypothetical protein [Pseudomonas sp. CCC3.2]
MKRRSISAAALPAIGHPLDGGFYAGRVFFDGREHALIDAGREFQCDAQWWDRLGPRPSIKAAMSFEDGLMNTHAMAEAGSAIAQKVLRMVIRGTGCWHIPSIRQLEAMRSTLLQLDAWDSRHRSQAEQSFADTHGFWSSTANNCGSAWNLTMHPWCTPRTNWGKDIKTVRPVKTLVIKEATFIHQPYSDAPPALDLSGLASSVALAEVLERFVNEDTGRFYGRTDELIAALATLGSQA